MGAIPKDRPTLPLELYRPIFAHIVSKTDLCVLAVISRFAQGEAEHLMYYELDATTARRIIIICRRICTTPRRGSYVRSLHLSGPSKKLRKKLFSSYFSIVAKTFTLMENLTYLNLESFWILPYIIPFQPRIYEQWRFRLVALRIPAPRLSNINFWPTSLNCATCASAAGPWIRSGRNWLLSSS
jgi:hypothetical protein